MYQDPGLIPRTNFQTTHTTYTYYVEPTSSFLKIFFNFNFLKLINLFIFVIVVVAIAGAESHGAWADLKLYVAKDNLDLPVLLSLFISQH